jgi:hypothetical protein
MKPGTTVLLCLLWPAAVGAAASLSIDWYTVDGGGGSSTAPGLELTGTIGQPDAGAVGTASGSFGIEGGFWGPYVEAAQSEAVPLAIRITNPDAILLSWPASGSDYRVQKTYALPADWETLPTTPAIVEQECQIALPLNPADPPTFFRLKKP